MLCLDLEKVGQVLPFWRLLCPRGQGGNADFSLEAWQPSEVGGPLLARLCQKRFPGSGRSLPVAPWPQARRTSAPTPTHGTNLSIYNPLETLGHQGVGGRAQLRPAGSGRTALGNPETEGKAGSRAGTRRRHRAAGCRLRLQAGVGLDNKSPARSPAGSEKGPCSLTGAL